MQYQLIVKLTITIDCKLALVRNNVSNINNLFFLIYVSYTHTFNYVFLRALLVINFTCLCAQINLNFVTVSVLV